MDVRAQQVTDRLAHLRAALLTGRGPGASVSEISEHTRDRPALQLVPAGVGRVGWESGGQRQDTQHPVPTAPCPQAGPRPDRFHLDLRSALVGAVATAIASSLASHFLRRSHHARGPVLSDSARRAW
jgi:hypothetical protein